MRHWGFDLWPYENAWWVACRDEHIDSYDEEPSILVTEERDEITCTTCLDSFDETDRELKEYEASK